MFRRNSVITLLLLILSFVGKLLSEEEDLLDTSIEDNENKRITINLGRQKLPYSTRLQFGGAPLTSTCDKNCTVEIIPPSNNGLLIVISYPAAANFTYTQAVDQFTIDELNELKTLVKNPSDSKVLCWPYLEIITATYRENVLFCSQLLISHYFAKTFFKGERLHETRLDESVLIKWYGGSSSRKITLDVSSYIDCSAVNKVPPVGYRHCTGLKCISSSLFCNGIPNCAIENPFGKDSITVLDETSDCSHESFTWSLSSTTLKPLFVPAIPTNSTSTTTTTKRPWWYFWKERPTTTTTTTTTEPTPFYYDTEYNNKRPWYSPGSPIGTVFIFVAVVVLIFGVCSFMAKLHSTRRPTVYGDRGTSNGSTNNSSTIHNAVFARQLIEMIEEERELSHNHSRSCSPMDPPTILNSSPSSFTISDEPPPTYKDSELPTYESLFSAHDDNRNINMKK